MLLAWLELPEGLIVGQRLVAPGDPEAAGLGRSLLEAMEAPLVGQPRRPDRIRVAEPDLAREVRAALGDEIPVEVAPTPELDELLRSLIELAPESDEEPSYLEGGRVSPDLVGELFSAARLLYIVAPWNHASDSQVLRLDIAELAVEGACVSVVGALGETLGLLVFPSREGFDAFVLAAEEQKPQRGPFDLGTDWLSLSFKRAADLPATMRREAEAHAWPVEDTRSYPHVQRWDRDGTPRPLVERDVRIASACAFSLGGFFARYSGLFELDVFEPVSESSTTGEGPTVHLTAPYEAHALFEAGDGPPRARARVERVGRNQPCPCGSGKKYKKCHLQADEERQGAESRRVSLRKLAARVDERLQHFAMSQFGYEWQRFREDFANEEETLDLALAWGLYHYPVRGQTILDWFLEEGGRLPAAERPWLAGQSEAWLSVWEVRDVKPGETLALADLLSHEVRCVQEVEASRILVTRDAILARVVDCDGVSVLSGTHCRVLSPMDAAEVVRRARSRLRRKRAVPVERLRDPAFGRYLIRRWEEAVDAAEARNATAPVLQNTDGDPLLLTTDHFEVSPGAEGLVRARLAALPEVHPPEPDDESPAYAFVRSRDDTVLGRAWFAIGSLLVETDSIERADALRSRVERTCGRLLRHRAREHADPLSTAAPPIDRSPRPASTSPPSAASSISSPDTD